MSLSTWLKRSRLKRVEAKLRKLRAQQRHLREKEAVVEKERKHSSNPDLEARATRLHEEKEVLTREINGLIAEVDRLKAELDPKAEERISAS